MLSITIPANNELWDEKNKIFISVKETTLLLEHSLVSISKWESKWNISFLNQSEMTDEQTIDYIQCMTLNKNVDPNVYLCLTPNNAREISEYIKAPMTATTFSNIQPGGGREIITSELIYYWMIAFQIPFECQKWHINRLLTLIQVCNIKNQPNKKLNRQQLNDRNRALNAARKKALNTRG